MSSAGPPSPEELADELGIRPEQAQELADAMTPLQNLTGVGSSVGSALEDAPGAGPKLVGTVMQNIATQVNLVSTSAEVVARGVEFYITSQVGGAEDLFPPPDEFAADIRDQTEPFRTVFDQE